jgi:hypothetical protein
MNSNQLYSQAQKLRADADTRRGLAQKATYNADTYRNDGDDRRADVELQQAQTLEQEADSLESQAEQLAVTARQQEARSQELDAERRHIEDEYKSKLAAIDKEQQQLKGGGGLF